jgi:hypothetical protein
VTLSDWHHVERRIGNRSFVAGGLEVRWDLSKKRKKRDPEWLGQVVVASVTGAVIHASSRLPVQPGGEARLRYGSGETTVSIVHVDPTDRPDTLAFAVEFRHLDPQLRTRLFHFLSEGRPYEDATT